MWPWSKFKRYETEIDKLRNELVLLRSELQTAQSTINRLSDRDARGRFKK